MLHWSAMLAHKYHGEYRFFGNRFSHEGSQRKVSRRKISFLCALCDPLWQQYCLNCSNRSIAFQHASPCLLRLNEFAATPITTTAKVINAQSGIAGIFVVPVAMNVWFA